MSEIKRTNSEFNRLAVRAVRIHSSLGAGDLVWADSPDMESSTQTGIVSGLKLTDPVKTAGRDPYNSVGSRARPRSAF